MTHSTKKILFIGSFLSSKDGTLGPAERLVDYLQEDYKTKACSKRKHKLLRYFDILMTTSFAEYDIIHVDIFSGQAMIYAYTAILIAKIRNRKIIANLHGGKLPQVYPGKKKMLDAILKRSVRIITPSELLREFFTKQGFNVKYIPNFIDQNQFPYKQKKRPFHDKILWVRAFSPEYNPCTAIRAIYLLKDRYPDVSLTMIGPDKGELPSCKQLVRDLQITDKVHFMGKVDNEKLSDYFHTHDIFINTPSCESFGLGVLEAVSSGIPVISFNIGEIPLLWKKDEEILLVEERTPQGLANKIDKALSSPEQMGSMALAAKEKANYFTWENLKKRWKELLEHEL
jgi:glycosyltransferase involved in cell wall biosynthesis